MVNFSDNVKLFLLFGIALVLIITLSVVVSNDNNSNDIGLQTSFCENFTISDDTVRQIFADGLDFSVTRGSLSVSNSNLECLPEQLFDKLSDENIEQLETSLSFEIIINAPLVTVHPDAFKTELDLGRITSITIDDGRDGTILETGDNLLAPFFNLLELTLKTDSTSISDTLVGDVTTLQVIDISDNFDLKVMPDFIKNQPFLQRLSLDDTDIEEIQIGFFEGLERFSFQSILIADARFSDRRSLTESDIADFFGTDKEHIFAFGFNREHCGRDQDNRRGMKGNVRFDTDKDTTVVDAIENCFPNDLFREFSDEELFELFPQDRDTSLLISSPLVFGGGLSATVFDGPEGLFNRVTSVTFQGGEFTDRSFNSALERDMFQKFTALEEVIFRDAKRGTLENSLSFDFIGSPCINVTKTFRFLNSLDFTTFPDIISSCPKIETLDFSGCLDFVGNNAELLNSLEFLNEIILTNTALALQQEGNLTAIAEILQVSKDIIVIDE